LRPQRHRRRAGAAFLLAPRCQPLDGRGKGVIGVPTADRNSRSQEPAPDDVALQEPDPPRLVAVHRSCVLGEAPRIDLDQRKVEAASAKVEERADHPPVEERCETDDERLRRQNATRNEARVAPTEELSALAGENGVDNPVVLAGTGGGENPLELAPEVEQADPIAPA